MYMFRLLNAGLGDMKEVIKDSVLMLFLVFMRIHMWQQYKRVIQEYGIIFCVGCICPYTYAVAVCYVVYLMKRIWCTLKESPGPDTGSSKVHSMRTAVGLE